MLWSTKDISVSYILIYEKITNFLTALPNSLNGTAEIGPAPELITETTEITIRQSVLQELEKRKTKLTIAKEEEKPNPSKFKSPVKRKPKFINRSSKENDKKRKKLMCDNISDEEKERLKKIITKEKTKRDNLDDNEKEQLRKYEKIKKKAILDNLGDEQKEHLKVQDNKWKKEKCDNLSVDEKEQLRKYKKKKGKKAIDSTAKEEKKAQLRNYGKKYSYVW